MLDLFGAHLRRDLAARFGEHAVRTGLRDGLFSQPWSGVIVERDRALELPTRAVAALLKVGGTESALSHQTAAALHGCTAAADCGDIHVTVPLLCRVRSKPGLIVHTAGYSEGDIINLKGLPVLALDLVLAELLCTGPRRLALACLDQALAELPEGQRAELLAEVDRRLVMRVDRRGTRRAEALLALATGKADSPPESWLRMLLVDSGFPPPVPQFEVRDLEDRLVYRLDLAWPELRIATEYDGFEAHEGRAEADAERDQRLAGRGWIVIRVRAADLGKPERVLGEVRTAFATRKWAA